MVGILCFNPLMSTNGSTGSNNSALFEAPETPAPLFAVRAFKSALFGTPTPADSIEEADRQDYTKGSEDAANLKPNMGQALNVSLQSKPIRESTTKTEPFVSPAKGILVTPGTNKLRRKTVSFGSSRSLRGNVLRNTTSVSSGLSPESRSRADLSDPLPPPLDIRFKAVPNSTPVPGNQYISSLNPDIDTCHNHQISEKNKTALLNAGSNYNDGDKDVTVDLQEPQSRSGQHWKRQYSIYHMKSDHEMRKLLKYTQNAKSFATKRDAEAVDLREKLKTALAKVAHMEAKVSNLASQLAQSGNSSMDTEYQANLVTQLAVQTTEILHYKRKVEELENAARKGVADAQSNTSELVSAQKAGSWHSAGLPELASPRHFPQAQYAVAHVDSLERENAALKKTILRVKDEMKQYEIRHKARREEWKRSLDKSKKRQASLKDQLKQQGTSHDHTLAGLKAAHAKEVDDLRRQVQEFQVSKGGEIQAILSAKEEMALKNERSAEDKKAPETDEISCQQLQQQTRRKSKTLDQDASRSGTRIGGKTNNSHTDSRFRPGQSRLLSVEMKDHAEPITNHKEYLVSSGETPSFRNQATLDQESVISFSSTRRLGSTHDSNGGNSSQVYDGNTFATASRKTIPPNRLAAAKTRIEMRLASKQQPKAAGKENIKPKEV